jgi:FixJ family two-component response regulator
MPFVTGLTVAYSVRKIFPTLPIVVLTAFGSPDVKAECLRQGAAAFLEKTLDTTALLDVIEGVFTAHQSSSEGAGTIKETT